MTNLKDLFRWNDKVEIRNQLGDVVSNIYLRLVGDIDYNEAQQHGLLASRKLRKKLKDRNSVEHQSLFLDLDDLSKEDLIIGVLMAEVNSFRDLAVAEMGDDIFNYELPENAQLEDKEKKQEAEEKHAKEKTDRLVAKMEEKQKERRTELETMKKKDLQDLYVNASTNHRCLDEFSKVFREYCVYCGSYEDEKFTRRVFSTFEEYRNASPNLKRQLLDAYMVLELSTDQLKN